MLRMAAATMHWHSRLRQTTHNRDDLVLLLRNRLGRRRRVSVIIVERKDIGRTNVENVLLKRKLKTRTRAHGTAQWDKEAQRYTPLAWPMSPTWLSHKSYLNRTMKVCGVWIVERTNTCCHTTTNSSITTLSSTIQRM